QEGRRDLELVVVAGRPVSRTPGVGRAISDGTAPVGQGACVRAKSSSSAAVGGQGTEGRAIAEHRGTGFERPGCDGRCSRVEGRDGDDESGQAKLESGAARKRSHKGESHGLSPA